MVMGVCLSIVLIIPPGATGLVGMLDKIPAAILWVLDSRSDFTHFDNLPRCWCLGDRQILQEAWGLVSDDVRVLLIKAELKSMELSSTNLGPKRGFTVAESVLWTYLLGPQLAALKSRGE